MLLVCLVSPVEFSDLQRVFESFLHPNGTPFTDVMVKVCPYPSNRTFLSKSSQLSVSLPPHLYTPPGSAAC